MRGSEFTGHCKNVDIECSNQSIGESNSLSGDIRGHSEDESRLICNEVSPKEIVKKSRIRIKDNNVAKEAMDIDICDISRIHLSDDVNVSHSDEDSDDVNVFCSQPACIICNKVKHNRIRKRCTFTAGMQHCF